MAAILAVAATVQAQTPEALEQKVQDVSLPAGPLSDRLIDLGDVLGVNIFAPDSLVAGKTSPGVSGAFTAEQAIDALLRASELKARRVGPAAFEVTPRTPADRNLRAPQTRSEPVFDEPLVVESIVVTGQKIERTLQDTKESVALISRREIEDRVLLDVEDVYLQAANVTSSYLGDRFAIRGISQDDTSTAGGDGDLGTIFVDDVALTGLSSRFAPANLWDVEQVEILRGPQSTNVGRNALAGAVIYRTADPNLDEFEAAARLEVGNEATVVGEGMLNVPVSDISALRLTVERSETDGFIENDVRDEDDFGRRSSTTARAKFSVEPSDRFSGIATLQYYETERGTSFYLAPPDDVETRRSVANLPQGFEFDGTSGSLRLNYEIGDSWQIDSITAFLDGTYEQGNDSDGGPTGPAFDTDVIDEQNISQELRFSYDGGKLRGTVGAYYIDADSESSSRSLFAIFPASVGVPDVLLPFYPEVLLVSVNGDGEREARNSALFAQWDYDLTPRLTLSGGLRYDYEEQSSDFVTSNTADESTPLPDPVAAGEQAEMISPGLGAVVEEGVAFVNALLEEQLVASEFSTDTSFEALLPELGLTYRLTDDVQISAFYKRGYRAGGSDFIAGIGLDTYDPEFLDNFEIAFRSEWLDGRLRVNANAYYGKWRDQQVSVPINGNIFNIDTQNAGESTIAGFELDTTFMPDSQTRLFASLGYAHTEFDEFCRTGVTVEALPDCVSGGVTGEDLDGNDFAVSPDWTFALGGKRYLGQRFYVGGNVTYQDRSFGNVENLPISESGGFTLVNVDLGYEADRFQVRLYARNLLDEFYTLQRNQSGFADQLFITAGPPREVGLILSALF